MTSLIDEVLDANNTHSKVVNGVDMVVPDRQCQLYFITGGTGSYTMRLQVKAGGSAWTTMSTRTSAGVSRVSPAVGVQYRCERGAGTARCTVTC